MKSFLIKLTFFSVLGLFTTALSQTPYLSVEEIEEAWKNHTTFQKKELLGLCDFLFHQGYYERAVLTYFRYAFLYPEDPLIPGVYYHVARSYDELDKYDLAIRYYTEVQNMIEPNSSEYRATQYRIIHVYLKSGNYPEVYHLAQERPEDPYTILFKGYAQLSELQWDEAKQSFRQAQRIFQSEEEKKNLSILIKVCEKGTELPKKSKELAGLLGILPGGGRLYFQDWVSTSGTAVSTVALAVNFAYSSTGFQKLFTGIPLVAIYGLSFWGTLRDIDYTNEAVALRFVDKVIERYPPDLFMNFPEPDYLSIE